MVVVNTKPCVLFVTPILGYPPKGGPELRIDNSIKALAKIAKITLYCRIFPASIGGKTALKYLMNFVDSIHFSPFCRQRPSFIQFLIRGTNFLSRFCFKRNFFVFTFETEADFHDVVLTANSIDADVIWLGFGNISYPLLKYIKQHSNIPVVVDTDSVWSRFVLRGSPFAKNIAERTRIESEGKAKEEEERWGTRLADVTTAVSTVDLMYYRSIANNPSRIHIFSNVIDLDFYKFVSGCTWIKTPSIYLAGSFGKNSPMEDSVHWMLKFVLPILKRELPEIHFYIIGRGSIETLSNVKDTSVTVVGELPSVLPYLTNTTVAIVPLRYESGTRFKILEAGACGIPVVSTTLGAEGLPITHGKNILIADSPEDFANAIMSVIRDRRLAERLGLNLKELVCESYSIDSLVYEGQNILEYLLKEKYNLSQVTNRMIEV